mgnify:CR=1 FL=1
MSNFDSITIAKEYLLWDPNEETKQVLKLLSKRMAFGTAGLRGPMGVGYCRMNELVILQTTQGLIRYLQSLIGIEKVASQVIYNVYIFIQ